jgi:glycolate oxidase FAD binding subunit
MPPEIVYPAEQAEVVDIVCRAAESGTAVCPLGGGTHRRVPSPPAPLPKGEGRLGIQLSTAKLNRLIEYAPDDMTITVEAGMTVAELNRTLGARRQWLPVDVGWPQRATVGGTIAAGAAGPRRCAYGAIRDYLLGFTAVDGQGEVFSGGGRVVKNAAGYNLCRLMAGSRGTLGVITQATLMVRPLPERSAILACDVPSFELAEKLLAALVASPVCPAAVELTAGRDPRDDNPLLGPIPPGAAARLCVGFDGSAEEVEWMLGRLREDWTALGMTSPVLMPDLPDTRFWTWLAEFPSDARLTVLPGETVAAAARLMRDLSGAAIQARAADGVIYVHGAVDANGIADTRVCNEAEIRISSELKRRFDPKNIFQDM